MKIKNRLYTSAGISIVLVIILISVIFVTSDKTADENEEHELTQSIYVAVSEIDMVMYEYLMHHEKRMEEQWHLKYVSTRKILEKFKEEQEEEEKVGLLKSIRKDYVILDDLFSQVTKNYKRKQRLIVEGASQEKIDAATELEVRLASQLLITSRSILGYAFRLAEKAHAEAMEAQKLAENLILILMIILAITVTTLSFLVIKSISKPLYALTKGAERIGKGDLEHSLEIKTKDELSDLAVAFNHMTKNLKTSRDELNKKITERKRAEEALRKLKDELEIKVSERTKELKEKVQKLDKSQKAMLFMVEDLNVTTKELKDTQEQLLRKERLATLGQFSGSISHELRNPLGVIDSSVYYLKMKLKDRDAKVQQHFERIESSVYKSTKIIQSLLDLTRMKKPKMNKNDLVSIVSESIISSKVPGKVKVIKDFPDDEVLVSSEEEQLRMALKNIIKNAVEAIDGKGTLSIMVQKTKDGQAEVSFADTGSGIEHENLERVFRPLFSTKARGIGFGLSITKMIIDNHNGMIRVESKPGKGTKFIINLPLSPK